MFLKVAAASVHEGPHLKNWIPMRNQENEPGFVSMVQYAMTSLFVAIM